MPSAAWQPSRSPHTRPGGPTARRGRGSRVARRTPAGGAQRPAGGAADRPLARLHPPCARPRRVAARRLRPQAADDPGGRGVSPEAPYGPADASQAPRYTGIRTFARCPYVESPVGVDVGFVGIPFDTATSYRTGAP